MWLATHEPNAQSSIAVAPTSSLTRSNHPLVRGLGRLMPITSMHMHIVLLLFPIEIFAITFSDSL